MTIRLRIRTLMVMVLIAGLASTTLTMIRRSMRYRAIADEYATAEQGFSADFFSYSDSLRILRETRRLQLERGPDPEEDARFFEDWDRCSRVVAGLQALKEEAWHEEERFLQAARRPWVVITPGEPIGPRAARVVQAEHEERARREARRP